MSFSSKDKHRIKDTVLRSERQAQNEPKPRGCDADAPTLIQWLGVIVDTGPSGEADWVDARYWVKPVYATNTSSDETEGIQLQQIDWPHPGTEVPVPVVATNLSESDTHTLPADGTSTVHIYGAIDEGGSVRHWFHAGQSGAFFPAVVTACQRMDAIGNVVVTVERLVGLPYSHEPETGTISAWAGVDPGIVHGSMVLIVPITPLRDNPEIAYYAMPHISFQPSTFDEPDAACQVWMASSCDPAYPSDPCLDPSP